MLGELTYLPYKSLEWLQWHDELRIHPDQKRLSVSAFVVDTMVQQAHQVMRGSPGPRPIGGWSFSLPDGWDTPLDDFSDWR